MDHYTRKRSSQQQPIADNQHRLKSNVLSYENTIDWQNKDRYIPKRSYEQFHFLNAIRATRFDRLSKLCKRRH